MSRADDWKKYKESNALHRSTNQSSENWASVVMIVVMAASILLLIYTGNSLASLWYVNVTQLHPTNWNDDDDVDDDGSDDDDAFVGNRHFRPNK